MLKEDELAGMALHNIMRDTSKETIVGRSALKNFADFDKDISIASDPWIRTSMTRACTSPMACSASSSGSPIVQRAKSYTFQEGEPVLVLDSAFHCYEKYEESVSYFF